MATKPLVPVEEYLRMSFEGPDPEYLDGELLERNLGDDPHSSTQANLIGLFHPLKKKFRIQVRPEIHMRLARTRIKHFWLADPAARTFSIFDANGLHGVAALELPEFELTVEESEIFE